MNLDPKLETELLVLLAKGKLREQIRQAVDEFVDSLRPPPPPPSKAIWRRF